MLQRTHQVWSVCSRELQDTAQRWPSCVVGEREGVGGGSSPGGGRERRRVVDSSTRLWGPPSEREPAGSAADAGVCVCVCV